MNNAPFLLRATVGFCSREQFVERWKVISDTYQGCLKYLCDVQAKIPLHHGVVTPYSEVFKAVVSADIDRQLPGHTEDLKNFLAGWVFDSCNRIYQYPQLQKLETNEVHIPRDWLKGGILVFPGEGIALQFESFSSTAEDHEYLLTLEKVDETASENQVVFRVRTIGSMAEHVAGQPIARFRQPAYQGPEPRQPSFYDARGYLSSGGYGYNPQPTYQRSPHQPNASQWSAFGGPTSQPANPPGVDIKDRASIASYTSGRSFLPINVISFDKGVPSFAVISQILYSAANTYRNHDFDGKALWEQLETEEWKSILRGPVYPFAVGIVDNGATGKKKITIPCWDTPHELEFDSFVSDVPTGIQVFVSFSCTPDGKVAAIIAPLIQPSGE